MPSDSDWLTRKEAAKFLAALGCSISPKTLANLAANGNAGKGPPFTQTRWKIVRYTKGDLELWAASQMRRVT